MDITDDDRPRGYGVDRADGIEVLCEATLLDDGSTYITTVMLKDEPAT